MSRTPSLAEDLGKLGDFGGLDGGAALASSTDGALARMAKVLSKSDFVKVCTQELDLDLSKEEIERLFDQLDEAKAGKLNFTQFRQAVNRSSFFKTIASNYNSAIAFSVARDYDITRSTTAQYRHPDYVIDRETRDGGRSSVSKWSAAAHGELFGPLRAIRRRLDYSYHVNYSQKRQLWQDQLVSNVVVRTAQQQRPWLVFTCGAMGSGKGYALNWLSKQGFFPLEQIVHIDPDFFKRVMPEWKQYVSHNSANSGTLCHHESGYIQEVAQEVALNNCQNVWIDGSLRDHEWYSSVFDDIHERHPLYRIAIFYVYCSEEVVCERAEKRAQVTGRHIPREKLLASIKDTRVAVRALSVKADYVATINNEMKTPVLEAFETIDRTGRWSLISSRFGYTLPDYTEFPRSLAPSVLKDARVEGRDLRLSDAAQTLLSNFTKANFDWQAMMGSDTLIEVEIDLHELLRRHSTSSQAAQQRLANYLVDPASVPSLDQAAEGEDEEEGDMGHWAAGLSPKPPSGSSKLLFSPPGIVNLDSEAREVAGVPESAFCFCMNHGLLPPDGQHRRSADEVSAAAGIDLGLDAAAAFLVTGGYVYFDSEGHVVATKAIVVTKKGSRTVISRSVRTLLQYGDPQPLSDETVALLGRRWQPCTLSFILNGGGESHDYCWGSGLHSSKSASNNRAGRRGLRLARPGRAAGRQPRRPGLPLQRRERRAPHRHI